MTLDRVIVLSVKVQSVTVDRSHVDRVNVVLVWMQEAGMVACADSVSTTSRRAEESRIALVFMLVPELEGWVNWSFQPDPPFIPFGCSPVDAVVMQAAQDAVFGTVH